VNPFIEVNVRGNKVDEEKNFPFVTKVILNNGLNPQFNEES
jgi:hypothetical protein